MAAGYWGGARAYVRRGGSIQPTVVQLPTRPSNEYTAKQRRRAIDLANGGALQMAADLWRAAITEFGVSSGLASTIAHGILGLPLNLHGPPELVSALLDGDGTPGDFGLMFPEGESAQVFLDGIGFGVGLGQLIEPEFREVGERNVPRLRWWDPRWLRQNPITRQWYLLTQQGEIEIRPGDREWIMFCPYGEVEPWRNAPWLFITLAFIFARDAAFDRQRHSEVCSPVRVMRAQKPTTKQSRAKAKRLLDKMQRDNRFILPEQYIYEVIESTGRIADIYAAIIEWAHKEWEVGLTGQTVTTEGGKGFVTEGTIHQRIARDKLRFFASAWFRCLREQALRWWAWENFGAPHAPTGGYNVDPPEDTQAKATANTQWAQSIVQMDDAAKKLGLVLDPLWVAEDAQKRGIRMIVPVPAAPLGAPIVGDAIDPEDEPTEDHAAALAAEMTEYGIDRCEHGRTNRCPLCGVERVRGVVPGESGKPAGWKLAWRAIEQAPTNEPAGVAA